MIRKDFGSHTQPCLCHIFEASTQVSMSGTNIPIWYPAQQPIKNPVHMLQLKPNCECCDVDLPPQSLDARICSFECTFCQDCSDSSFGSTCPNCSGELVKRPIRPSNMLEKFPASTSRFLNEKHSAITRYASRSPQSRNNH